MSFSKSQGKLIVLTGPSGVGKGSLIKKVLERHNEIWLSISATTRLPRPGEVEGKHYFFLDRAEFENLIEHDGFLEWAEFAGNLYGTPRKVLKENIDNGRLVLLEIELEGSRQIRKSYPGAMQIFLAPPNFNELESRIRGRATDKEEAIRSRLLRAREELKAQGEFDAVVINDDFSQAIIDLEKLMGFEEIPIERN